MNAHGLAPDIHDLDQRAGFSPEHMAPGASRRLKTADIAAGVLLAGLGIAVAVNALVFQGPGVGGSMPPRSPAAGSMPDKPKAPKVAVATPAPVPAPAHPAPTGGATDGSLGYLVMRTTGGPPPAPTAASGGPAARPQNDSVRRPLAAVGSAPAPEVTGAVRPPAELPANARVLSVQKALARLGYGPIKVDGRTGTETRLAVQRFQRDRNLPADGEISDRLVRELSAVTGTAVN
ncbi:peptidoglycan-binding domain-containing protein [Xanthobacter pseudotagetidis]|uniref:peptidoglycan-binding domain-containing protein n=1 Tax=Xanthobacter pseudotagetidis TaxID=3119911 RepID=UPI00372CBFE6